MISINNNDNIAETRPYIGPMLNKKAKGTAKISAIRATRHEVWEPAINLLFTEGLNVLGVAETICSGT